MNRRTLLKGAAGLGLGLTLGGSPDVQALTSNAQEHDTPSFVRRIQETEERIGDRPLTLHDAEELKPFLSEMYAEAMRPEKTAGEFAQATYIITNIAEDGTADAKNGRITKLSDGKIIHSEAIAALHDRYPDMTLTPDDARSILIIDRELPGVYGMTTQNGIFIFLDHINNPPRPKLTSYSQFEGIDHRVPCTPPTPATSFRSVVLHEDYHFDIEQAGYGGRYHGFTFFVNGKGWNRFFEELGATYTSAAVNDSYGFNYETGYGHEPHDYANFREILRASGLSDTEMAELHRYSGFDLFLLTLLDGSSVGLDGGPPQLNGPILAFTFFADGTSVPNWSDLQYYFPNLDTSEYSYDTLRTSTLPWREPNNGCIFPEGNK